MKTQPKLLTLIVALLAILILVACGQAAATPTPVELMAPDLALFSPTDIVPTLEGTLNPLLPTLTNTFPSKTPTPIERPALPPGETVMPAEEITAASTQTEASAGPCSAVLETEAFEAINQRRASAGVGLLRVDERLNAAAYRYSEDMGINGAWDHIGSDGESPFKRIHDAGYSYWVAAENISAGHNRGVDAVEAWMNSDGHRINMLNLAYIDVGIACYYKPDDTYSYYWTAVFAAP
jgi:uncharacterized protein YkwD